MADEADQHVRRATLTETGEHLLRDLLDASAVLWTEINYQRLMRYNDEDGFEGDVWDADTGRFEGRYKGVLGASTAQQVTLPFTAGRMS